MARVNVWPATPVNPKYAFTFKFLDWAEALLLECQVPLRDLCAALSFKCSYFQVNVWLFLKEWFILMSCIIIFIM